MRRGTFILAVVVFPLAVTTADLPASVSAQSRGPSGIEVDALDRKADPCVDFYQLACGGWVAKNPLPPDRRSFGRFAEVQEHNFTILRRILDGSTSSGSPAAAGASSGTSGDDDRRKASDYYAACMDEAQIEAAGLTPLTPDLSTI